MNDDFSDWMSGNPIAELWEYIRYQARRIDQLEEDVKGLTEAGFALAGLDSLNRTSLVQLEQQLHDLTVQVGSLIEANSQ